MRVSSDPLPATPPVLPAPDALVGTPGTQGSEVVRVATPTLAALFGASPGAGHNPHPFSPGPPTDIGILLWSTEPAESTPIRAHLDALGCPLTLHHGPLTDAPSPTPTTAQSLLLLVVSPLQPAASLDLLQSMRERSALPIVLVVSSTDTETLYRMAGFEVLTATASLGETRAVLRLALVQWEIKRREVLAHEAMRALEENTRLLESVIGQGKQLFYAHSPDHRLTYVSPQVAEFFELPANQPFRHWTDFLTNHATNAAGLEATRKAIASGQRQPAFELEFITARGRRFRAEAQESPIVVGGRTVAVVGVLSDATEKRRSQDLLRLQTAALRISANSIVITNRDGVIEWANEGFCRVTGYSLDEALNQQVGVLINSGKHDKAFFQTFWEQLLAGQVWHGEITNRKKDGTVFQEESTVTPILDEHGVVTHFIAVKQDITERKLLEAKMRQAQKMEAVGQLAGGVAHDFNNILAAVLMYLGLLQDDTALDVNTRMALKDLEREVQRGASLTRQLLTFSRQQAMEPRPLDLHEIISGLLKMLKRLLGEHISLNLSHHTGLPLIEADASMIEQVVINLCVNARDAMTRGGPITLTTQPVEFIAPSSKFPDAIPGRYVRLTVSDKGTGMDESTLQHIFEPFFTTKEIGRGTGLGLATVYGIVRQHHGWVDVESTLGAGTSFHVYFPVAGAAVQQHASTPTPPLQRGRGETVLVTEDEASVRKVVALSLRRHGYTVIEAENGPAAVRRWREHQGKFDLLLSDMVMPEGMTGREVAEMLRKESPGLKVILCTGYSQSANSELIDPATRITLLRKPFDPARLLSTVRQCLDAT